MLAELLETVNMIPPDATLLDVFEVWNQLSKKVIEDFNNWYESEGEALKSKAPPVELISRPDDELPPDYPQRVSEYIQSILDYSEKVTDKVEELDKIEATALDAINHCLEGLPKKFRDYVWQDKKECSNEETIIHAGIARYTLARQWRENLRLLIEVTTRNLDRIERLAYLQRINLHSGIDVDDRGFIRLNKDIFIAAVEDVDARRIKECPICRKLFWAGRITQQGCSTACSHALRNRRYRARYKDYLVRRHLKESASSQQGSKAVTEQKSKKRIEKKGE